MPAAAKFIVRTGSFEPWGNVAPVVKIVDDHGLVVKAMLEFGYLPTAALKRRAASIVAEANETCRRPRRGAGDKILNQPSLLTWADTALSHCPKNTP